MSNLGQSIRQLVGGGGLRGAPNTTRKATKIWDVKVGPCVSLSLEGIDTISTLMPYLEPVTFCMGFPYKLSDVYIPKLYTITTIALVRCNSTP